MFDTRIKAPSRLKTVVPGWAEMTPVTSNHILYNPGPATAINIRAPHPQKNLPQCSKSPVIEMAPSLPDGLSEQDAD